jgi:hypothetical protein
VGSRRGTLGIRLVDVGATLAVATIVELGLAWRSLIAVPGRSRDPEVVALGNSEAPHLTAPGR